MNNKSKLVQKLNNKKHLNRIARHQAEIDADETNRMQMPLTHSTNMSGMDYEEYRHWLDRELDVLKYQTNKRGKKKRRK